VSLTFRKAWNRLSRMSWDEFRTRLGQELGKRAEYAAYRAGLSWTDMEVPSESPQSGNFFFSPDEVPDRVQLLKKYLPETVEETVNEAGEILRHRFRLLGYRDLDYGAEIDWHLDAVHGKRATLAPWYKIRFLDFDQVGDHKVTLELNRHQHLVTLAKAWAFTGDDTYLQELSRQFYSWRSANPFPLGINWGSSLEVAFRSLSWLWVRQLIGNTVVEPSFDGDLVGGLARNGRYIERYLSTYFSPNTHLIGEAVALFFIGTLCPQIPHSRSWKPKGLSIILAEAERQVRPDGVYFEQSLYYHVYALDFFLHTRALAARNQIELPASFDAILRRMLEVLRTLSQCGVPPTFGDDDGGRLFNPRRNRAEHMTDPLSLGAAWFEEAALLSPATITEEAIWLFGEQATMLESAKESQRLSSHAFEDGGLYIIASDHEMPSQMVVDAGPHGIGHGGHGHADALSVSLSVNRRRWLIDPGSYMYIAPGDERDEFRGTAAHNTLRIDHLDQAVPETPFSWHSIPRVSVEKWFTGSISTLLAANHSGYRRLADPVLHRRIIFHLHGGFWLVRDIAEGQAAHELQIFWHFAPDLQVAAKANLMTAVSPNGEKLALVSATPSVWNLEVQPGFVSPAYGQKQPASIGVCSAQVQLPVEHATLIVPLSASHGVGHFRQIEACNNATGYEYQQTNATDCMIFGNSGPWNVGPIHSDAACLFIRRENGEASSIACCSASFLEMDGRRVFSSPSAVERLEWTRTGGVTASDPQSLKFFNAELLRAGTPVI
jgi:hypothetical protein